MAMNLIQVQNRLRDLPANDPRSMQILTSFANGQNPQVPPFIALAELNRRKQLTQQQAQPPEATVKDRIEQEVKMMQTNAGRQQEAMQGMGQQAMMANAGRVPASTPQTEAVEEESFAAGGIADLNSQFDFAKGGIVAFAKPTEENNNSLVVDPMLGTSQDISGTGSDDRTIFERLGIFNPENRRALEKAERAPAIEAARKEEEKVKLVKELMREEAAADKPAQGLTPEQKILMLMGNRAPSGAPAGTRPAGGAPVGGDMYKLLMDQVKGDKYESGPDLEKFMEEQRAKNPDMQGKAGGKLETLIEEIRRQDMADRAEAKAREEARQSNRFLDVISGAGQNLGKFKGSDQRGKSGVLNLLGGIGQQYKAMGEEDVQRSKEQRALQRQQDLAYAQMIGSIEDTRRAEATGNAKDIFAAKKAEALAKQNFNNSRIENLFKGATAEESLRSNKAREDYQRSSLSQQGRDSLLERAAVLARDPKNEGKGITELMQLAAALPTGVQAENAETKRMKDAQDAWVKGRADRIMAKIMPGSPEEAAEKIKHYKNWGVNLGDGAGGGGSTVDTSQFNVREKGSK
jgi:hypothetical protein